MSTAKPSQHDKRKHCIALYQASPFTHALPGIPVYPRPARTGLSAAQRRVPLRHSLHHSMLHRRYLAQTLVSNMADPILPRDFSI